MSWRTARNSILAVCAAGAALAISGCGSSTANVITVSVTPSALAVLAGQVETFTATVSGSTNTTVTNWDCTYAYTPPATTADPNPKAVTGTCTSGATVPNETGTFGSWTISTANGSNVLTYTAPSLSNFPNPNIPVLTFTASADADKKKTATATIGLDSGIRVTVTPLTATVPVGLKPNQTVSFSASLQNSPALNLHWNLVQFNSLSKDPNDVSPSPFSDSCSPTCGTIDQETGIYTAPDSLPTDTTPPGSKSISPTTLNVVVNSNSDSQHFAVATITLVDASKNPVTFSGIFPNTVNIGVAAGGISQDIFLNAKNLLNTSNISFVAPSLAVSLENASTTLSTVQPESIPATQFSTIPVSPAYCTPTPAGTTTTPVITCDASLITRVRLLSKQLAAPEPDPDHPAWILIPNIPGVATNNSPCVVVGTAGPTTTSIACPFHIVNVGPGLVASVPDSFSQASQPGTITFGFDGGNYGVSSGLAIADFDGQALTLQSSTPRRLLGNLPATFQVPQPGLYQSAVTFNNAQGAPPLFPLTVSNAAVQPNFSSFSPAPSGPAGTCTFPVLNPPVIFPSCEPLATDGSNLVPSSIAVNSTAGYAVLTEQGANALQMIDLTANPPALMAPFKGPNNPIAPTGVALNPQVTNGSGGSLGAVVSSGDGKVYLYWFSRTAQPQFIASFPVALSALLGQGINSNATPFAIGIDPGTNLGVVAYSNLNINTNLAFIVNLNPPGAPPTGSSPCFAGGTPPCAVAPVTVNTGTFPQVIMQPNVPIAYVTPGGSTLGTTSVVNLLQNSTTVKIAPASATKTSSGAYWDGISAHITTTTAHGIDPTLGGTVIISGITSAGGINFNGTFSVSSVIDAFSFTYQLPPPSGNQITSDVETNTAGNEGTVQYGTPYFTFNTTSSASGGAINPISRTFAYADFNNSSSQIGFISTLDQSLSTLSLSTGSCNGCNPTTSAPETNFRSLAFDPFVNVLLAYAPGDNVDPNFNGNKVSFINPGTPAGITAPTSPTRIIAAIPTGQAGVGSFIPTGQTTPVVVNGPMGYDPKTKLVLVANAGSNSLSYMSLDPQNTFKGVQILSTNITSAGVSNNQPPLGTAPLTKACSFLISGDPTVPACMPQAVPLGQPATIQVFGKGFSSGTATVRLDRKTSITPPGQSTVAHINSTVVSDSEIDATIDAGFFFTPHTYSLDVQVSGGSAGTSASNSVNLFAVSVTPLAGSTLGCTPTAAFPQGPEAVAIDPTLHIALITNFACNSVSVIAVNPAGYQKRDGSSVPYGTLLGTVAVGTNPIGIDVLPRMALAVVANHGVTPQGTASVIDYSNPESPVLVSWPTTAGTTTPTSNSVTVGLAPIGVAIDQDRAIALVTNNGSNTLSAIDLTVLLPSDPSTATTAGHIVGPLLATSVALSGPPTAIAVDPVREVATVSVLQNPGTTSVTGALDVVNLATNPPLRSSTASVSSLTATITGLVYDPGDPLTTPVTPSVFYAASTQANAIFSFNPDTGSVQQVRVGINPYSVGYNPQTGTLLTINSTSNSASLVDVQTFKTVDTLGITSQSQFAIAVDPFTNTAVIVDQNNNRVLGLALP
ncbi:MAG TPA: hypothetical protein VFI38_11015 [Candidatus Acidoferrum sp.]|nr:hypothetical protein [Candidatus Acidoferrum sp.]